MAIPTLAVYLGAAFDPATADIWDEPSSWTNITSDVREAGWQRGRQAELDQIQAGTGGLILKNSDRAFDPTWLDGPYYPLTDRQVKIEATLASTTYSLFRGWTANWRIMYDADAPNWSEVAVELEDAIGLLNRWPVGTSVAQTISARIGSVLNGAGFPAGMRDLTGGSTVWGLTTAGPSSWQHIQDCVISDKDLNVCRVDGRGYVVFGPPVDSGATFGDAGGTEIMYSGAELDFAMDLVYSRVVVTRQGGTPQAATGDASHGIRSHERSTLNGTDADALVLAQNILANYAEPKPRPEPITIRPGNKTLTWEQVLGLELEDQITLKRTPPGGGDRFEQPMTIVGLAHQTGDTAVDWTTTYRLAGRSVLFPASGTSRPLDTFNRANEGPPMTGWTAWIAGGLKVLSNQCAPNTTGNDDSYWSTAMTSKDQEAYVTVSTLPAVGGATRIVARLNPAGGGAAGDWYDVYWLVNAGADTVVINRWDNTVLTQIAGPFSWSPSAGDGIGIRCRGSRIEAWGRLSGAWELLGAVTDTTYTGGGSQNKIGLQTLGNGSSIARYDNFGGGSA